MRRHEGTEAKAAPPRSVLLCALAVLIAVPGLLLAAEMTHEEAIREIAQLKERIQVLEEALQVRKEEPGDPPAEIPLPDRVEAIGEEVDRLGYAQRTGAHVLAGLEGIKVGGSATGFSQGIAGGTDDRFGAGADRSSGSFSGDLGVSVPIGTYGQAYARALVGEGKGVGEALPPTFSSPNADLEKHDDGASIVELWYQAELPFPSVTDKRFAIVLGKMDPRRFFDANSAANNQREQFLADTFVNNLAIDWGGDDKGYGLGARLGYRFTSIYNQSLTVEGQLGVFQVGGEHGSGGQGPFVIAEIDVRRRSFGLPSNYRLYAWTNRADHLDYEQLPAKGEKGNWGFGVSFDQRLTSDLTLFARYGWQDPAVNPIDHTITVGGQIIGNRWRRGGDILGLAAGYTHASGSYGRVSQTLDGLEVSGGETFLEAYYSYFFDSRVRLSPDLQYIHNPGGVGGAEDRLLFALRAQLSF